MRTLGGSGHIARLVSAPILTLVNVNTTKYLPTTKCVCVSVKYIQTKEKSCQQEGKINSCSNSFVQFAGRVPYFSHWVSDILPWEHCCVHSNVSCGEYKSVRPSQTCENYTPPTPGKRLLNERKEHGVTYFAP